MDRPPQIVLQRKSRTELERLLADGNTARKIAKRARIVLMSADGHGVMAIMREVGISKTTVWRWQEYFVEAGVDGLVTVKERPANATHWSVRTMAEESQPHERATDLGRARAQAASGEELQDLQRPRFPQKG